MSVAWHALTSLLLLALVWRVVPRRRPALLAALAFALHPVHAEAMAGLVGRAEVQALAFMLLAALLHLERRTALAALGLAFAFGSKEVALVAPALLLLLDLATRPPGRRPGLAPFGVYALVLLGYLVLRRLVLGGLAPDAAAQVVGGLPLATRLLVAAEVTRDAAGLLLAPRLTSAWYPFTAPTWSDPGPPLLCLAHVAVLALALATLVRGPDRARRALAAGLLGFYVTLGPVSNLVVPIGVVRAERALYSPSAFVALALAAALARLPSRGARARLGWAVLAALLLVPLAPLLARNVAAWVDEDRLRRATLERFPAHGFPRYAMGQRLLETGDPRGALALLEAALPLTGAGERHAAPLSFAMGSALRRTGRAAEALPFLEQARALSRWPSERVHLGVIEAWLELAARSDPAGRARALAEAERVARAGTLALPRAAGPWRALAQVLRLAGREDEARAALERAAALAAQAP